MGMVQRKVNPSNIYVKLNSYSAYKTIQYLNRKLICVCPFLRPALERAKL